jgi:hypothetical protein
MMTFLGTSNTFLSVLVTLIVLCILSNSNNFIHEILAEIKKKIDTQICSLKSESNFGSITSTTQYKLLQYYIKEESNYEYPLYSKALELDMKIKAKIDTYQGNVANDWMRPAQDATDLISNSKEQILSPLFALMIALVAFIIEEVVSTQAVQCVLDAVATFLTYFLSLSLLFLIFFWLVFAHDVFKAGKEKGDKAFSSLTKALHYRQTEFYSYENLFSIFFLLFLFSLIITAIQYVFVYCYQFEGLSLVSYDNIKALRYVMLCMVVVAGLVLPFLGPYCGYRYVLKYATNLNEKEKHDKDAMKNEFLRQLDEICDKIK